MRVTKSRTYDIKNRIALAELPDIVHAYLAEQKLSIGRFMFYFEELLHNYGHAEPISSPKAVKDMPELGEIHILDEPRRLNGSEIAILSNMADNRFISEQTVIPYLKRFQKIYGFSHVSLNWFDIDFFGSVIETMVDRSEAVAFRKRWDVDPNPLWRINENTWSSKIAIEKGRFSGPTLSVTIDLLRNNGIVDASPYFCAMNEKLPGIKYHDFTRVLFSDEEKRTIAELKKTVEPLAEKCKAYFVSKGFEAEFRQQRTCARYALGEKLKKISKQYGFTKKCKMSGNHELMKLTPNGHKLAVEADSGPSHCNSYFNCVLIGLGYILHIGSANFMPMDQKEFDNCADDFFEALEEFSHTDTFCSLDELLPPAPDWYLNEPDLCFF